MSLQHPTVGPISKAVVLARGLGTRMRQRDDGAVHDPMQARVADSGLKAMIPIGRPFLDYVLSALADAGIAEVCLVIGPEHTVVRAHYERLQPSRLAISFAEQVEPRGTADAVVAARAFAGDDPFLVLNGDNYYPVDALATMTTCGTPALAAFHREALVGGGDIDAERVRHFALLRISADGVLDDIVEKPDEATSAAFGDDVFVSMNLWAFDRDIFEACRRVAPSPRGELELPQAVRLAMSTMGMRVRAVPIRLPVLDLSRRADIARVAARLAGVAVRL